MSDAALDATGLLDVLAVFGQALATHRDEINALNVFPVPDGDTGTNMLATVLATSEEIAKLDPGSDMNSVCSAIAKGSLMGARGNSGVILCQILRGLAETFRDLETIDSTALATGFERASAGARAAVLRPVEGTILTVAAAAAAAAKQPDSGDLLAVASAARDGAIEALWHTPEQLAVLAEAGVVDAGGTGLSLLYESFVAVIAAQPLPERLALPEKVAALVSSSRPPAIRAAVSEQPDDLTYEVMFLLETEDALIEEFRSAWGELGDSIVVVGGEGLWNCHIHTNDIGAAIEAGIAVGTPRQIRVTDLRLEVLPEEAWVIEATSSGPPISSETSPIARTAVVAIATGDGIARIFSSLGVARVVSGGQSMNPSTKEILEVIEQLRASEVVVLPNNSNIIPVARQLDALTDKHVEVVETTSIQQAFACLLEFDPESSAKDNATRMGIAAQRVVDGEVTQAVRAASSASGSVKEGDWIGLSKSGIESVASSMSEATCGLLDALITDEHEIITLIEGASCSRPEVEQVLSYLADRHPQIAVERLLGGQPLYPLLISIE